MEAHFHQGNKKKKHEILGMAKVDCLQNYGIYDIPSQKYKRVH